MNTTAKALVFAVASVAAAVAAAAAFGTGTAERSAGIVKLERVVIIGKRVAAVDASAVVIAKLPRVVIEGRRSPVATEGVQVAEATAANSAAGE